MCSIIGVISCDKKSVRRDILDALYRLEYRGYDSAGISMFSCDGLVRHRSVGEVRNLCASLPQFDGVIGIGHTRWATHGKVTESNAHPQMNDTVAIVHNGIIENFAELKEEMLADGYEFESETDTEVIAALFQKYFDGDPKSTSLNVFKRLNGSFALAILFRGFDDLIVAARKGNSPLAIGKSDSSISVSSDAIGLSTVADRVHYMDSGTFATLSCSDGISVFNFDGDPVDQDFKENPFAGFSFDESGQGQYMLKEIYEQPEMLEKLADLSFECANIAGDITMLGCGTAYYACQVGRYFFEQLTGKKVAVELASEQTFVSDGGTCITLSQSGETADTLRAVNEMKKKGKCIVSIVNVPHSSLARESDHVILSNAGPEIGVASTKAFTAQIFWLLRMAARDTDFSSLPEIVKKCLALSLQIESIAAKLYKRNSILYIGRGVCYPLAMEGALKMKELSYIHAEGIAAGELKHGCIALIDETIPVVALAPSGASFHKTFSNIQEVAARSGNVIVITDEGSADKFNFIENVLVLPSVDEIFIPFTYAPVMQLLAYYTALYRGCNIDKPRNLAKSVTVE